jgi:two-component system cell cycle response regulator
MPLFSSKSHWLSAAFLAMAIAVGFLGAHAVLGVGGHSIDALADTWLYTAVELIAVTVCAARTVRRREDRWAWALVTFALLTWTCGDLLWTFWLANLTSPPSQSVTNGLYLAEYPAVYVAVMLLLRSRHRHVGAASWLDGGVVGLTVAAVGAGLILPTVLAASKGQFAADAVTLAYPLGDLALLMFVIFAFSLSEWRPSRLWLLLGAAITISAVADIIHVYQAAEGIYLPAAVLYAMWPASMSLFAAAAWQPVKRRAAHAVAAPHTIIVTLVSVLGAWGLLMIAAFRHVTPVAVGLAGSALLLGASRAVLTYRDNFRILRRSAHQAVTDGLTGLGNRRQLMDDLDEAVRDCEHGHASTLVFFDLNGFKRYNDDFGHAAGDSLLARIGAALSVTIDTRGHAYRLGGDEFCVLLQGRVARRDPLVTSAAAALTERGTSFTVSASFGLATVPDDASSASTVLQLADQRMYADKNARSSRDGRARTRDVLMQLLDESTPDPHYHVNGVGQLVADLAREFALDSDQLDEILRAAELHDIGKLAIPDDILEKPGPLNDSEWQFMRQHSVIGERILNADPAMRPVALLVRASHERWDGSGYPDGLAGAAIPLGARIIAACDAYEAMTSKRCYQATRSKDDAIAELHRNAGSQFDPTVIEALCRRLTRGPKPTLPGSSPRVNRERETSPAVGLA